MALGGGEELQRKEDEAQISGPVRATGGQEKADTITSQTRHPVTGSAEILEVI